METMRSFLGLVNYLNRFSPLLAELSEPLRQICRQNVEFELTESVHVALSRTREEISRNITLPYFNPNSSITLQTNASKKGLSAVLLQNSKPIMFASRALTGIETNYQNLERECLVMIWGMEKFHYFLYGKEFTLETDQKPLVSIYKKHMVEISPRIQRLIIRSFPYQPFNIQYKKGVEIPLADTLSRVTPTPVEEDGIQLPIVAVNLIMSNLPVSSTEIELIYKETSKDPTLTLLRHYIHMGWLNNHRMLPQELHTFWNYREDLSMMDIWVLRNACSKQETLYSGQAFPMTSVRLWKNVEFVRQVPKQLNQLEMSVMFHLMGGILWALTCSTRTKLTAWWLEITSPNT